MKMKKGEEMDNPCQLVNLQIDVLLFTKSNILKRKELEFQKFCFLKQQ